MSASLDQKQKIFSAYLNVGNHSALYDKMLMGAGFFGRLALKIFWDLSEEEHKKFFNQAFAGIPKNFSGRLLEVPVGTGILSFPVYEKLSGAEIFCLDFSESMLAAAENNSKNFQLANIIFRQGDVGNLPFQDNFFDLVVSVDGFHVFPDKSAAYSETFRVLKSGGIFCGCMYVTGQSRRTDFFVEYFCNRFGFFTPPHETLSTLEARLNLLYKNVKISNVKSFAGFVCEK